MPKPKIRFRALADDERTPGDPVPIYCQKCQDTGVIPVDPIFVNTEHNYGIEYRSEEPCPACGLDESQGRAEDDA